MKKLVLFSVLLMICKVGFAQFPSPTNFEMHLQYIPMDETGMDCTHILLWGPTYLTFFSWEAPDFSETEYILEGYNIYVNYKQNPNAPDAVQLFATTTEPSYCEEIGIMGEAWITAIYSNPEGESEPSNIESIYNHPIAIQEIENPSIQFIYDNQSQTIQINEIESISLIEIVDLKGRIIKSITPSILNSLTVSDLNEGIYIVKLTGKNSKSISRKLIKL